MATLGTQDMAQAMALNAARRGDNSMGLGYMLGSMLANAWNRHDTKKQQRKMDAFLDGQKADTVDFSNFLNTAVTPEQTVAGGSVYDNVPTNHIGEAQPNTLTDSAIASLNGRGVREYLDTAPRTKAQFDPERMEKFKRFARENNLREEVFNKGKERVEREQKQDAEALYMPQILKGLYGYKGEDGKFVEPTNESRIAAIRTVDELAKYSPDKSKMLEKLGYAGMEGEIANARKVAAANNALKGRMALASMNNANKVALKSMGKYPNAGYSPKDVAGAYKAMQTIEGKYVDELGNKIPSSQWSQLDRDEYLRNKNIYYGGVTPQGPATPRPTPESNKVNQLDADVEKLMSGKDMNDWDQFSKTADSIKELLSTKYGMKGEKLNRAMQQFFAGNDMAPTYFGTAKGEAPQSNKSFSMNEVNTSNLFNEFITNPQKFRDNHGGMSYNEYIQWLDSEDAKE